MGSLPMIQVRADQGADRRGVVRFDLSDIPQGAVVTSARLYLYTRNLSSEQITYLYRITHEWSEDSATWNVPWANPGGDFDESIAYGFFVPYQTNCYISLDLTALVQMWVDGQSPNYGILLYSVGKYHTVEYASKEDQTRPVTSPLLDVIFVHPVP